MFGFSLEDSRDLIVVWELEGPGKVRVKLVKAKNGEAYERE